MRKKIYWSICLTALLSMVVATLLTAWLLCRDMQTQMRRSVATEVRYLEAAMETSGEDYLKHLRSRGDGGSINRITWVAADGSVLFDSYADPGQLENHSGRPEIREALESGKGESVRLSDTLAEQTYYYASRLKDGSVIRVASTTRSALATMANTIPWMIAMAFVILGAAMLLAGVQTRRIVEPINRISPDAPQAEKVYDELAPLVRRLEKQKQTIRGQMETLREKQEEFTAITENMKEGFIVVDSRGDVISHNSSAARILGADMECSDGANVNVLSLNRSGAFRRVVDAALDGRRGEQNMELYGRYYQIIANPVAEGDEKRGAVVVILDVTEQQKREELRREFTANVSHELKTPLTSISGYAEIMKNGLVQAEDMGLFYGKIYEEAQRLIALVGDIIRLSQLDEETEMPEKAEVDLYAVAEGVVERLASAAEKAEVSLELTGSHAVVHGAAQILEEMIFNLCDNAIKYNKPSGKVTITVETADGHPAVTVKDNGIGILKQDQERVFERFYRVDKSRSRQIGGTGLGLSIVKHGAAYHKAKVELTSKLGEGTVVKLVF